MQDGDCSKQASWGDEKGEIGVSKETKIFFPPDRQENKNIRNVIALSSAKFLGGKMKEEEEEEEEEEGQGGIENTV